MQLTEEQQLELWEIAAIAFFQQRLGLSKRQAEVFLALDSINTTCTDLSEILNTTPSAVSRSAFHLVLKGLAERDSWDPREKVSFNLTPKGEMELDMFPVPEARPRKPYREIDRSILPIMTAAEIEAKSCN